MVVCVLAVWLLAYLLMVYCVCFMIGMLHYWLDYLLVCVLQLACQFDSYCLLACFIVQMVCFLLSCWCWLLRCVVDLCIWLVLILVVEFVFMLVLFIVSLGVRCGYNACVLAVFMISLLQWLCWVDFAGLNLGFCSLVGFDLLVFVDDLLALCCYCFSCIYCTLACWF